MAFVFSLAAVLAVRRQREEKEERVLAQVLTELREMRLGVERLDAEMAGLAAARAMERPRVTDGFSLQERYTRIRMLRDGRAELAARVEQIEGVRDRQSAIYRAALREREMLSEMEARQRAVYESERARGEQRRQDDLYLARRLRSRGTET